MSTSIVITNKDCRLHRPGIGHPESPDRLAAALAGVPEGIPFLGAGAASPSDLEYIHHAEYINAIRELSQSGSVAHTDPDTVVSPGTWQAALGAVGAMRLAIEQVMASAARRAFCVVRPPGHHAERSNTKGFCFFNTIAIGACIMRREYGIGRIAIIDWDAHHGNGTQDAFLDDAGVLYVSLHQYPLFPGTGRRSECGMGAGKGYNLNIPMSPGATDRSVSEAFGNEIEPAVKAFRPEIIMISAGFDGHIADRLSGWMLTENGYGLLTRRTVALAGAFSQGRIISLLEGGYDRRALTACVNAHMRELDNLEESN